MPWKTVSVMSLRKEFVLLANAAGTNRRELCRRFGISPKTGYKWLKRFDAEGVNGLLDRSRRPRASPHRTDPGIEQRVIALRRQHPDWGGRKLRRRLLDLGHSAVPSPSTITDILRRHGLLDADLAGQPNAFRRFQYPTPNDLWQMDFKGHFATTTVRCHPLTVLDDHSRFNLVLQACADESRASVQTALTGTFSRYGLPRRMLVDNGSPWGLSETHQITELTVWLVRLGISVCHARPYHPQTLGKDERFHRTLKREVLRHYCFHDLAECQTRFDYWRDVYNTQRPHEALDLDVPARHYQASVRPFPETLPRVEYALSETVRKVQAKGELFYRGRVFRVSRALRGCPVALRSTPKDGVLSVVYCSTEVAKIDLRKPYE
jgi:transposase InsO family protein